MWCEWKDRQGPVLFEEAEGVRGTKSKETDFSYEATNELTRLENQAI